VRRAAGALLLSVLLAACGTTVPAAEQVRAGTGLDSVAPIPSVAATQDASTGHADDPVSGTGPTAVAVPADQSGSSVAATPPPTSGPATATAGSAVPDSGPGWTTKVAYVGVTIQSDASAIGGTLGYSSFDFGNQRKIISAAIAGINARGGVLGRQVVPLFFDYSTTGDNAAQVAAACALWTQDHKVISASLVGDLSTDQMFQCLHKAHVPIITGLSQPFLVKDLNRFAPELQVLNAPSIDRMIDPWIDQLKQLGYFSPWNSAAGKAGNAPVKVGILHQDVPFYARSWALVKQRLEQRGIVVSDVLAYAGADVGSFSNFALRLRTNGVTHLFLDNLASAFYPAQAESQGYRARYAVSSFNYLQPFLIGGAPKAQLSGMLGIGWLPHADVKDADDPGAFGSQAQCLADMRRATADISKRNYRFIAFTACDVFGLLQKGASLGNGFAPAALVPGLHAAAPGYRWGSQFAGRFAPGDPTGLAGVRGLSYVQACGCIRYVGRTIAL
jgi:hypothetical protein